MFVRMLINITGFHSDLHGDMVPWPPVGGVCELSAVEAAHMIANGYAVEVTADALDAAATADSIEEHTDATDAPDRDTNADATDDSDTAVDDSDAAGDDLEDLDRDALIAIAETEGVKIRSNAAADKIITAIREARAAS